MGKDYYAILQVPRDADATTLKKAYRRLAMRWHPDKNPNNVEEAQAKFQEISDAYDVLNDPQKRQIYDQFGEEGLKAGGDGGSRGSSDAGGGYTFTTTNANEVFRRFFGDDSQSGFGGFGGFGVFENLFDDPFVSRRRRNSHGRSGFTFTFGDDDDGIGLAEPTVVGVPCTLEELF
jgi:DnaJ-class molecular chaperone